MRAAAVLVVVAVALGAASSVAAGTSARTWLRVTYWEDGAVREPTSVWRLRCNPPRGSLPRPAVACRRLARGGWKQFAPIPPDTVCTQIYGGPQKARVVGRIAGRRIWVTFTRTDGCQIGRWNQLSPWLLPPGGITR